VRVDWEDDYRSCLEELYKLLKIPADFPIKYSLFGATAAAKKEGIESSGIRLSGDVTTSKCTSKA
jgi:hypothetical protein